MWFDYMKERFGYSTVETEFGFVSYTIQMNTILLQEIYVKPESRGTKKSEELLNMLVAIGKGNDCTRVWAQVWSNDQGCSHTLKVALGLGFKVVGAENNRVVIVKEIGE